MVTRVEKSDREWRDQLAPREYAVTRKGATEPAFSGRYYNHHEAGCYQCVCCGLALFDASKKYDSGSGWPSFTAPVHEQHLAQREDRSHGMQRIEVRCAACDAHLGHVFPDGPQDQGGSRYCINSAALNFKNQ